MRLPWKAPTGNFSWSTLWMNLAAMVTVLRYALGDGSVGPWHPGPLDPTLAASVMGTIGGLYGWRRGQENTATTDAAPVQS